MKEVRLRPSAFSVAHHATMRDRQLASLIGLLFALLSCSCNQPFTPKAPFEPQPVVYSVICTDSVKQYVRVYTTYDVSGYDPYENKTDTPVGGATVIVTGRHGTWTFRDTLLERPYPFRYKTPILAYVADWQPEPGETYTLVVNTANAGSTEATITTPKQSTSAAWSLYAFLLDFPPDSVKAVTEVYATFQKLHVMKVWYARIFVSYIVQTVTGWREEQAEVEVQPAPRTGGATFAVVYCARYRLTSTIAGVSAKYAGNRLIFKRVVFHLLEMDENWFKYYNMVRRAQDSVTTRFDLPDYTNFSRGHGLFGACTVDSLIHSFPNDFVYNH